MNPLTFGHKLVGLKFNPSGMTEVDEVKKTYADLIDTIHNIPTSGDYLSNLMRGEAIKKIADACMWTVKVLTHK